MSRRCTLHIPDMDSLKSYLTSAAIPHKPGVARYEVLQIWVRHRGVYDWAHIYDIPDRPGFYTGPEKVLRTIQTWEQQL